MPAGGLFVTYPDGIDRPGELAPTFGDVIQAGLDQADDRDAVTAILGLLPARVRCTRVSLDRPRGERMDVEAVSGISKLNPRSKRVRGMGRVMQEALDAGTALHYPDGCDDPPTARQRLVRGARLSGLCSVPLIAGLPEPVVLLFEFADDAPWTAESPQRCSEAAHAVIPLIELRREQGRPWWRRLQALVAQGVQRLAGAEVNEMGITLLVFLPAPYVDASAASALRDKSQRMLIGAAGILVEGGSPRWRCLPGWPWLTVCCARRCSR